MKLVFLISIVCSVVVERAYSSPHTAVKDAQFHGTVTELMKTLRHEVDYITSMVYHRLPNTPAFDDSHHYLYTLLNDIDFYKANYDNCPFVLVALDYDVRALRNYFVSPGVSYERKEVMDMLEKKGFLDTMNKIHVAAKKLLSADYYLTKQLYEHVCYSHRIKTSLIDVYRVRM